ncbi:MAG: hypothetical protein QG572_1136, partial [Pseudomonadota bacterium]|nr:hypothetical protein [Pseudomonadota bacterium]
EAQAVLADLAQKAQETAKVAIERAAKAKRRPVRKVVGDARKALHVPEIATSPDFRDLANQIIGQIKPSINQPSLPSRSRPTWRGATERSKKTTKKS